MSVPKEIRALVQRFADHIDVYRSANYNETQLRDDFLNPFFRALGWDVDNIAGYAQAYRDVIKEETLRVAGAVKAPDFSFRIGGTRKFFVEAKRPSVRVRDDAQAAFQLRRYAWSAKLPLSILTDFEELAVYDCRFRPEKDDPASTARIFLCRFDEYQEKWDWISSVFSKEAILRGSFDKYAEKGVRRGTSEVDADFLATIESWRTELARVLALRNPTLTQRELNFSVQRLIDRIIFLRICEDRGIEDYGRLLTLAKQSDIYEHLSRYFLEADNRYNSGLFHFKREKNRDETPDTLTLTLAVDDSLLKKIIRELYYPDSPYEFSVIPADILGQVYEQFLGKVIRLTDKHRAVVEFKPEVKKAGGVYYTPTYIVQYIIERTLAGALNAKTPKQIERLKVLDPACGSGSFLIEAYQFLLDWYLAYYVADDPAKLTKGRRPVLVETATRGWKLTLDERKRILLTHIYGVDVDAQAVEVTKLSLLLKVLEGETERTIEPYLAIFHERALPDLGSNIKCGNSLIGTDFYSGIDLPLDLEQQYRINAFDWDGPSGFAAIMQGGGFDVVIGNPPYIFVREQLSAHETDYFSRAFSLSWEKNNTYLLFMELLLRLTKKGGKGSFIVPNSWLTIESGRRLRQVYADRVIHLADLNYTPFQRVSMEPCIFVTDGDKTSSLVEALRVFSKAELLSSMPLSIERKDWKRADGRFIIPASDDVTRLFERIRAQNSTIGDVYEVRTGLQAYEEGKGTPPQTRRDVKDHVFDETEKVDETTYKYLEGRDVGRFGISWSGTWLRYGPWLSQPRDLDMFTRPRVLVREITGKLPYCLHAAYIEEDYLNNKSVLNVLHRSDSRSDLKALACILNSKLMSVYYKQYAVKGARKLFPKIVIRNLREFPFPKKRAADVVKQMADINTHVTVLERSKAATAVPQERSVYERQISAHNKRMDALVYDLFGLSQAERAVIETYGLLSSERA